MRRLLSALLLFAALAAPALAADADLAALGPRDPALAPRAPLQIPGARIGWRIDDLRTAFRAAAVDGLPVVVATEGDDGGLFANVLRCPTFNTLAGQAHFVLIPLPVTDESSDAARVIDALHMDSTFSSTIAVIDMSGAQVNERLRVNGYVDEAALLAKLAGAGLIASRNPLPLDKVALGGKPPSDCER
ncbi:MAG TPA: hypothetical protein VN715_16590 [Roseiarcus sp.]|nr:hypothetical protein [Roseiarcus sp.]